MTKKVDEEMEDVCEKVCVFEDSLEIDFDYEFDVAKFFDFTRPETVEEVVESEMWFHIAQGHPPSPLVVKLDWGTDEQGDGESSSSKYGHQNTYSVNKYSNLRGASEVSSLHQEQKGQRASKSKSKCLSGAVLPRSSRLLQPTASLLAKQNQQSVPGSTRVLARHQKLGSPLKSPGEVIATKRQKLEIGYLRKVAQLKHQTSFSHKLPKKVRSADVNSAKPKVTIPKEPHLATADRAQRHRSKNTLQLGKNPKSKCNTNAPLQEKSDPAYRFQAHLFNKKIFSCKGDVGVFQNSKLETNVPRVLKLSDTNKLSQNLPIELFKKLSLNYENHHSSLLAEKQPLQIKKGLKENIPCSIMKENKIPNVVTEKSRCCRKQNEYGGGRTMADLGNHPTSVRSLLVH